jgi:hypothetical protein
MRVPGRGRGDGLRVLQRSGDGLRADQGIGAEAGEGIGVVRGGKHQAFLNMADPCFEICEGTEHRCDGWRGSEEHREHGGVIGFQFGGEGTDGSVAHGEVKGFRRRSLQPSLRVICWKIERIQAGTRVRSSVSCCFAEGSRRWRRCCSSPMTRTIAVGSTPGTCRSGPESYVQPGEQFSFPTGAKESAGIWCPYGSRVGGEWSKDEAQGPEFLP